MSATSPFLLGLLIVNIGLLTLSTAAESPTPTPTPTPIPSPIPSPSLIIDRYAPRRSTEPIVCLPGEVLEKIKTATKIIMYTTDAGSAVGTATIDNQADIDLFFKDVSRIGFRKVPQGRYSYFSSEVSEISVYEGPTKTLHFKIYARCSIELDADHEVCYVSPYFKDFLKSIVIKRYQTTHGNEKN
jgi:hypothetical protein